MAPSQGNGHGSPRNILSTAERLRKPWKSQLNANTETEYFRWIRIAGWLKPVWLFEIWLWNHTPYWVWTVAGKFGFCVCAGWGILTITFAAKQFWSSDISARKIKRNPDINLPETRNAGLKILIHICLLLCSCHDGPGYILTSRVFNQDKTKSLQCNLQACQTKALI